MRRITRTINVVKDEYDEIKVYTPNTIYKDQYSHFICHGFVRQFFPHIKSKQKEDVDVKVSLRESKGSVAIYLRRDQSGQINYTTNPQIKTPRGLVHYQMELFLIREFGIPCGTNKKIYVSITK